MNGPWLAVHIPTEQPLYRIEVEGRPVRGSSLAIRAIMRMMNTHEAAVKEAARVAASLLANDPKDKDRHVLVERFADADRFFVGQAKPLYEKRALEVGYLSGSLAGQVVQSADAHEAMLKLLQRDISEAGSDREKSEALWSLAGWLEQAPYSFQLHFEELIRPPEMGGRFSMDGFETVDMKSSAGCTALLM